MKRLSCLLVALALALTPISGSAQSVQDSIVRQLRAQGFSQIEVRRTLLGRSRIVARSSDFQREIIVNPVTGEILRDFTRRLRSGSGSGTQLLPRGGRPGDDDDPGGSSGGGSGGSGSGGAGDDDDDDDDGDDDDGDDDDDDDD